MTAEAKPVPHETELSKPYWDAARQGVLKIQKCGNCGAVRHYPQLVCPECFSRDYDWIATSGRSALHSWTVCHHAFHAAFKDELPYILATVDLEEGPRALGRLVGIEPEDLKIGLALSHGFADDPSGTPMLTFRPA